MPEYLNLSAACSTNAKLGKRKVATNYRPVGDSAKNEGTCPSGCAMLNNGCYAETSFTGMHQKNANTRYDDLSKLISKGMKYVRLHTSGDFFTSDGQGGYILDLVYWRAVLQFANENPDVTIWTYCHDVTKIVEFGFSYKDGNIPANLHIVASIDKREQHQFANDYGFRTARVIKDTTDRVKGETLCPYDYQIFKHKKRSITCVECKLCFNPEHKHDIAFLQH